MKSTNKKKNKNSQKETAKNSILTRIFIDSEFAPYIIPSIYFIIYGFIIMTNHPIGDYGVEIDFYRSYG